VKLSQAAGAILSSRTLGGGSDDLPADLAIDPSGSPVLALVTSSAELPTPGGFQPQINGVPGSVSYDGGFFFYPVFGISATVNHWLLLGDGTTMYVSTQGQGVYHSSDRGQTWDPRNAGLPDTTVTMVAGDPASPLTLYAATAKGLAKSTNGGVSWANLTLPAVTVIAIAPKDHNQLYAAGGCAFYHSTDAGRTWQTQQAEDLCVSQFLTDPNDANGVYAMVPSGVLQGPTWTRRSTLPGMVAAAADPANFSIWYACATGGIYRSEDKGSSWTLVNPGDFSAVAVGRPHLIAGTRTGELMVSLDGGASWNATMTQPADSQPIRSLFVDSGTYFVGTAYHPAIWLAKLSPFDGSVLYGTFLGGSGSQNAARIAVDGQANITVAFETDSTDALTTPDAIQRRSGGGVDLLLTRLSPSFSLRYATYYGGFGDERLGSLRMDLQGLLYLAGSRDDDALALVFNPGLTGIVYTLPYGGSAADQGIALVPSGGNAVLIGQTQSPDLPVTAGPAFRAPSDSFAVSFAVPGGYQTLGAIRNAASLLAGPVANGSLVTIDGNFGDLAGVSVTFNGSPAVLVQVRDTSMDVVVPADAPVGQTAVVIVNARAASYQGTVPISSTAPGLFSANRNGQGVALGTVLRVDTTTGTSTAEPLFQCDSTSCAAIPVDLGDDQTSVYLVLTATGLRNQTDLAQFQVTIGGMPATVIDVQPQGVASGLDAITIQLPQPDTAAGPLEWQIQVNLDGKTSNPVTILVQ
jgi:uncharacterized protein (TIGR03437 family)